MRHRAHRAPTPRPRRSTPIAAPGTTRTFSSSTPRSFRPRRPSIRRSPSPRRRCASPITSPRQIFRGARNSDDGATITSLWAEASAGCVLANRLSADPSIKVLLIEAGGGDSNPLFSMPAGFAKMTKGVASWGWSTVPQKHLNGRVIWYTQAKVIGGGSTINAQLYTRGNAKDYDAWVSEAGCEGWSYKRGAALFQAQRGQRSPGQRLPRLWRAARRFLSRQPASHQLRLSTRGAGGGHSVQRSTSTAPSRTASAIISSRLATPNDPRRRARS